MGNVEDQTPTNGAVAKTDAFLLFQTESTSYHYLHSSLYFSSPKLRLRSFFFLILNFLQTLPNNIMPILNLTQIRFTFCTLFLISLTDCSTFAAKGQTTCEMCSTCDNPCKPLPPPPPPPIFVVDCPPPPSPPPSPSPPPPAFVSECPRPPAPTCDSCVYTYPSPPATVQPNVPPVGGNGGVYNRPPSYGSYPGSILPSPNLVVPYFPYYYNTPPSSTNSMYASVEMQSILLTIILLFISNCVCFF